MIKNVKNFKKYSQFFKNAFAVFKDALSGFGQNAGIAAAGNMAFLTMFCLFPFLIFLISLSGTMGQTDQGLQAITFMLELLPPEVSRTIQKPINGILKNTGAEILTFSIIFALFTAASGIEAGRDVVIRAFGREHSRGFWIRRLESLAFVIVASILVILSMSVQVIGPAVINSIDSLMPEILTGQVLSFWAWISNFLSPALLSMGLYIFYLALTPRSIYKPFRLPGALLTLVLFLSTAKGLSAYLKSVGTYDVTYGSLAGIVITQLFCFIVSLGFIFGAEFNAAWTRRANRMRRRLKKDKTKAKPAA